MQARITAGGDRSSGSGRLAPNSLLKKSPPDSPFLPIVLPNVSSGVLIVGKADTGYLRILT
jgi:hypothetical protein